LILIGEAGKSWEAGLSGTGYPFINAPAQSESPSIENVAELADLLASNSLPSQKNNVILICRSYFPQNPLRYQDIAAFQVQRQRGLLAMLEAIGRTKYTYSLRSVGDMEKLR